MAGQWFYSKGEGDNRRGPFTADELKRLAASGELRPDDRVWKRGRRKWVAARKVQRLFEEPRVQAFTGDAQAATAMVVGIAETAQTAVANPATGSGSVSRTGTPTADPIVLPAAAQLERQWLRWRASRGHRGASPSESFAFFASLDDQTELTDQLLLANTKLAAGTNPLLGEIARTLNNLGFTAEGAVEWLARKEKLHADYYDSLRRQKGLRELLGLIARFQEMTDGLYDAFSRAYGARLLVETLERHRFSSRELGDHADKEVFSRQLAWAGETIHKLPQQAHADIENFEKACATYHWLKGADPEAELRELKRDVPGPLKLSVPTPAVPFRGLGTFWILLAVTAFWTAMLLMVCLTSLADDDPPPGGYFYFLCALDGPPVLVTLTVFLVAHRRYRRALRQYNAEREAYQQQRSKAIKESKVLLEQVQAHNGAIDKLIPGVRQDHQNTLASLRQLIDEFLVVHPQLPTFVSPV